MCSTMLSLHLLLHVVIVNLLILARACSGVEEFTDVAETLISDSVVMPCPSSDTSRHHFERLIFTVSFEHPAWKILRQVQRGLDGVRPASMPANYGEQSSGEGNRTVDEKFFDDVCEGR